MDQTVPGDDGEFEVDLEMGVNFSELDINKRVTKQENLFIPMVCGGFLDSSIFKGEKKGSLCCNVPMSDGLSPEKVSLDAKQKKFGEEKRKEDIKKVNGKKSSNKKSLKPPRPPRGPSLDAADQKLIREISEIAMLKRARVERMKALKHMKAAKSSSSVGNMFSVMFTLLLFLLVVFQGMSSRRAPDTLQGSPMSAGTKEGILISTQYKGNPSGSEPNGSGSKVSNLLEQVSSSGPEEKLRRVKML